MLRLNYFRKRQAAALAARILNQGADDSYWSVLPMLDGKFLVCPKNHAIRGCVVLRDMRSSNDLQAWVYDDATGLDVLSEIVEHSDFGSIAQDNVCILLEEMKRLAEVQHV